MENITLTINGKSIRCPGGTTVLEAANQNGIKIPRLCYHPDLKPAGACRLCLVEDEKTGRLMASCVMPVSQNMAILTDSPRVKKHRRNVIRLMMAEHPESCLVCSKGNRCRLRQIAGELGVGETGLYHMSHYRGFEEANPFIIRDINKCILCGKCIRADMELVVVGAIDYNYRGFNSRPATLHELPLENSTCTFCGTCVSMCPTGALMPKNSQYVGTPQRESSTICGFCGVGCSLDMGSIDGQVVEVNPSCKKDSVNRSALCIRGHFAHDFLNVKERLTHPMIRRQGEWVKVPWDEALDYVAERLAGIKKEFGPQSIGFLGSSKCTNEENYLFQKIARVILGTNNIDNGGYLNGSTIVGLLNERTAGGWRVSPLDTLECAESIVVLGADPTHSLPVVGYYLKRAAKKGIPLIVADPRKTELARFSSVWLPVIPNKDVELIDCLAALLWKKFAHDSNFIQRFTRGITPYTDGLSSFNVQRLCVDSGPDMDSFERAACLLAGKKIAFLIGGGILQQRNGSHAIQALINLSLMTGSLGHKKGGIYVLAKENNQMGAADMGALPDCLPGDRPIRSDAERKLWEKRWNAKISPDPGLNLVRMIQESESGNLKALFIMGENPLRSLPQKERVRTALEKLDFLVVQDILATETYEMAHAVLPGAAFSEKGGSFTNLEGRIQSFLPAAAPPGEARPDWKILSLLYERMGTSGGYSSLEKIRGEIRRLIPMYEQLGQDGGVSWVKHTSHLGLFHPEGKGDPIRFSPVIPVEDGRPDDVYNCNAILGSQRYHLGCGTRTSYSARIRQFDLKGEVEISHEDASAYHLKDGDTIKISSPSGSIVREVKINKGLVPGFIFVPIAFHNNDVMNLIELGQWGEVGFCGLNECRVRIEVTC